MASILSSQQPSCKILVLDAGPLLSLSPLRGLAETYITVPQVLDELKDKRAREHFERLGLTAGVQIKVQEPDAGSLAHVIQFAKKTGDYSVLSHADLCVLALTYALDLKAKAERLRLDAEANEKTSSSDSPAPLEPESGASTAVSASDNESIGSLSAVEVPDASTEGGEAFEVESASSVEEVVSVCEDGDTEEQEPLEVELERVDDVDDEAQSLKPADDVSPARAVEPSPSVPSVASNPNQSVPIFDDPSDEEDGEGEWITPSNVEYYKSCALDLLPSSGLGDFTAVSNKRSKRRAGGKGSGGIVGASGGPKERVGAGCMTADFAMQNVLLQMGLNLVGVNGKKIERVKTWVLRCHACFKICKDSSKKFCPTCGNATLLRTSVTTSSPTANESTPAMQIHLKKNYTYRTRGTVFSIPMPKPGSSKKGTGEGLILREDQTEYLRAKKHEEGRKAREERKLVQGALAVGKDGLSLGLRAGSWMDPDWVPEILTVGTGGKGRSKRDSRVATGADGMPVIGHGKKNPNERRRRK